MGTRVVLRRGNLETDDGLCLELGTLTEGKRWFDFPLPECPDCGGKLYIAGKTKIRKCSGHPIDEPEPDPDLAVFGPTYDLNGGCGSVFEIFESGKTLLLIRSDGEW